MGQSASDARRLFKRMNRRNKRLKGQADANEAFVKARCVVYMTAIMEQYPVWDVKSLEFIDWLLQDKMETLNSIIVSHMPKSAHQSVMAAAKDMVDEVHLFDNMAFSLNRIPKRRLRSLGREVVALLECALEENGTGHRSSLAANFEEFKTLFDLTDEEAELCLFLTIMASWTRAENFFDSHLDCDRYAGRKYVQAALRIPPGRFEKMLHGRLRKLGFINFDRSWLEISKECMPLINESAKDVLTREHYQKLPKPTVSLDTHVVKCGDLEHLNDLLAEKQSSATHVLFYGPPGTGKTSFTRALASTLGCPSFEVMQNTENKTQSRRLGLTACLNLTNHGEGSVVVVDEADTLLNTDDGWFVRGESQDKGWLNALLEEPGTRVIWITNRVENIDQSVRRRFAYSLHFPKFGRKQREQLWLSILRKHRIKRFFTRDDISQLAGQYEVSAGAMDLAVDKARGSGFDGKGDLLSKLHRSLAAHLTLERGGLRVKDGHSRQQHYVQAALNLNCSATELESQVKRFDKWWRMPREERPVRSMNLLFHGPSGTGKTELVRHFAQELDRPLLVKRTSDLMGSFVGETERAIARAFDQAETDEAVLLFDEADSLLFPRSQALRSWEVSFTNEFLTQMERFRGMLFCTTNRIEGLDDASLRRFSRKVEFGYLEVGGILVLYEEMLMPLVGGKLLGGQQSLLREMDFLTPGIFRVVRDEAVMNGGVGGNEGMIAALNRESQLMAKRGEKLIGFG
jgi:transitional endoplasmic reticulum ATPase